MLAIDLALYCAMWFAYETTRGAADGRIFGIKFPLQVQSVRNIDRVLFFGHDPNSVLQEHFWRSTVHWWDKVASLTYFTHFIFVPIVMGALVGHQSSPVGPVHEALRHGARCCMRDVHPAAHRTPVDGRQELPPHPTTDTQCRTRLHCDGLARCRDQLEERSRLGQRRGGHAVAARVVRADRSGLLPAVDQAGLAEGRSCSCFPS